jgi:hypothetical protein
MVSNSMCCIVIHLLKREFESIHEGKFKLIIKLLNLLFPISLSFWDN